MVPDKVAYSGRLSPALQVEMEERLAALLFDHPGVETGEEDAAELGRDLLYLFLRVFRPDVFVDAPAPGGQVRCPHGYNLESDFCLDCINEWYNRAFGG